MTLGPEIRNSSILRFTEKADVGYANYRLCSCQEAKIEHDSKGLNKFQEHLLGGISVFFFNGFIFP